MTVPVMGHQFGDLFCSFDLLFQEDLFSFPWLALFFDLPRIHIFMQSLSVFQHVNMIHGSFASVSTVHDVLFVHGIVHVLA